MNTITNNSSQEYDKAIRYIYKLMAEDKISIGDRLPTERVIAAELGIGRNSIREALSILGGMGIIERKHGSGNYISPNIGKSIGQTIKMMIALKAVTIKEVCAFRRQMEKSVCAMLCEQGIREEGTRELKNILAEMKSNEKNAGYSSVGDKRFHDLLILNTENRLLIIIMEAVTDVYREWIDFALENVDAKQYEILLKSHIDILKGIEQKNVKLINEAIDLHYDIIDELFENA